MLSRRALLECVKKVSQAKHRQPASYTSELRTSGSLLGAPAILLRSVTIARGLNRQTNYRSPNRRGGLMANSLRLSRTEWPVLALLLCASWRHVCQVRIFCGGLLLL